MLQEVPEFSTLLLRYKYYAFFDLNPKVSINHSFIIHTVLSKPNVPGLQGTIQSFGL